MANYYATARSNYFAVKDEEAFKDWVMSVGLEVYEQITPGGSTLFMIAPSDMDDCGAWPSGREDKDDEWVEIDLLDELSVHLADEHVAVLMEVGNEKLRYVNGFAQAVNNKGEYVQLSLNDIYEKAASLGSFVTAAEY